MKITFRKIAQTLSGFSTPLFGISWNPSRFEVDIADGLLTFLEDRRVLYDPLLMEQPSHVTRSVLEIRQRLTEDLQKVDRDSELATILRTMRVACRDYMRVGANYGTHGPVEHGTSGYDLMHLMAALMDLRAIFGTCIGQLCMRYGLDIEESLATIVPSLQTAKLMELSAGDDDL